MACSTSASVAASNVAQAEQIPFTVTISKVRDSFVVLSYPEKPSFVGYIPSELFESTTTIRRGATLSVVLEGYDISRDKLIYRPV